jgi:hypothetical protein
MHLINNLYNLFHRPGNAQAKNPHGTKLGSYSVSTITPKPSSTP